MDLINLTRSQEQIKNLISNKNVNFLLQNSSKKRHKVHENKKW